MLARPLPFASTSAGEQTVKVHSRSTVAMAALDGPAGVAPALPREWLYYHAACSASALTALLFSPLSLRPGPVVGGDVSPPHTTTTTTTPPQHTP